MKVLESHSDSNSMPRSGADNSKPSGDVGRVGFSPADYPSTGPATKNDDVPDTRDSIGALGQDGATVGAYKMQPKTINAKNPSV